MKKTLTKYVKVVNESKGEGNIGGAEWRRDLEGIIFEGREGSLRKKSTGFKTGSRESLEATLLRGPSAKECVKKTEMSAQALEERRRT